MAGEDGASVRSARAALQVADRTIELIELALPESIGPGEALLRVEGCGMCGTDYEQYVGAMAATGFLPRYPVIPGHEPVGRIEVLSPQAREAWGLELGDRVAVEAQMPDGFCYAFTPVDVSPGLWGGFAEYMLLRAGTILHRIPDDVTIQDAVLFNPLGGGFEWVERSGMKAGDNALVLGAGQRGLACVIALREAGANRIIVTGLERDRTKLELAREFGATDTIVVGEADIVETVHNITDGLGVERVFDLTPFATESVTDAIRAARAGGTIVLIGVKGGATVPGFISDDLIFKSLTLIGAIGVGTAAIVRAIDLVAAHRYPLEKLHTHTMRIDDLERAMQILGGEIDGEDPIHITVVP